MKLPSISPYIAFLTLICAASPVLAQTAVAPNMGAAAPFAVLGGTAVTCVGPGTINGDVGSAGALTPGTCTISGASTTPVSGTVTTAFPNARDALNTQNPVCTGTIPPGGGTLSPGVWCSAADVTISGIITLNGNASDVWVFRVGTGGTGALTLNSAQIVMGGTASACNVYWKTAEAVALTDSNFLGYALAGTAATITRGDWVGGMFATTDATVTDATVTGCAVAPVAATGIPTLSQWAMFLLSALLAVAGFAVLRRRMR